MNDTLKVAGRIGAELGAAKAELEKLRGLLEAALYYVPSNKTELRALIDAALEHSCKNCEGVQPESCMFAKQSEPTDTYTAVDMATAAAQGFRDGQAAVEQAPAQDEREAPIVVATAILGGLFHGGSGPELGEIDIEVCTPALETIQCETVNSSDDVFLPLMTVAQHERIVAALTRPAQTEQQPVAYPHEAMDKLATDRYRVGAAGAGTLHRFAVRAGDGEQELYRGSKSDCQNVARKLAGAFLDGGLAFQAMIAAPIAQPAPQGKFRMGDRVKKSSGSEWVGHVCGWYSTNQTPEGYAVESEAHAGSVQIYPAKALEAVE